MKYYNNYMQTLATNPHDTYMELMQASINAQWDNTTQVEKIYEQQGIGSEDFDLLEVRVDYAIDMGTGFKQGDDFKEFAFQDLQHKVAKGLLYQYDNDFWITVNTSELGSIAKDVVVRRCNNVMRWINRSNGFINEIPCVIEYVLESPKEQKDKDVKASNGHITVICQGNEETRNLQKNTRFIFNKEPYRFLAFQKMLNENTFDDGTADLLYLDMYLDMVEPDDDITNNIANYGSYVYEIEVAQSLYQQAKGGTVQLFPNVTLNGKTVERDVVYETCECGCDHSYCTVDDNGLVTITGEAGEQAQLIVSLKGNPQVNQLVVIDIVGNISDNNELIVSPIYNKCRVKSSITFSVNLYTNGAKQDNIISYTPTGVPNTYYDITREGNTFTLYAKQIATEPLIITFSDEATGKAIGLPIEFTSLF